MTARGRSARDERPSWIQNLEASVPLVTYGIYISYWRNISSICRVFVRHEVLLSVCA